MLYKEVAQLNDEVMAIIQQINSTTDPTEQAELAEKLQLVAEARDDLDNKNSEMLCKARQNCIADNEALKMEIKRLQTKLKYNENAMEYFEGKLLEAVNNHGGKFVAGTFNVGTRKSTAVVVDETVFNDARFETQVVTTKIDKMAIKAALKDGEVIEGAELVENINLSIR